MEGKDGAIDLAAQGEIQNRLRNELLLQSGIENDRIPQGAESRVRQAACALNALRFVPRLVPHRCESVHRQSFVLSISYGPGQPKAPGSWVIQPYFLRYTSR